MIERLLVVLWEAERDRGRFLAAYDLVDVRQMSDADFERWKAEYKRLYDAVYRAEVAYHLAVYSDKR